MVVVETRIAYDTQSSKQPKQHVNLTCNQHIIADEGQRPETRTLRQLLISYRHTDRIEARNGTEENRLIPERSCYHRQTHVPLECQAHGHRPHMDHHNGSKRALFPYRPRPEYGGSGE